MVAGVAITTLASRILEQLGVGEGGGREGRLGGDEHDDHLGAPADAAGVALVGELLNLLAHAPGVSGEQPLANLRVLDLERVEIRVERYLCVDRQPAAAGQADDQVGSDRTVRVGQVLLGGRSRSARTCRRPRRRCAGSARPSGGAPRAGGEPLTASASGG